MPVATLVRRGNFCNSAWYLCNGKYDINQHDMMQHDKVDLEQHRIQVRSRLRGFYHNDIYTIVNIVNPAMPSVGLAAQANTNQG